MPRPTCLTCVSVLETGVQGGVKGLCAHSDLRFRVLDHSRQVVFSKTPGCSLEELEKVRWGAGAAGGAAGGVV